MQSRKFSHSLLLISLYATILCVEVDSAFPQSSAPIAECESTARAVRNIRSRIEAARKVLSDAEARCAFADFNVGALGADCAKIKKDAYAHAEKRQAWSDAVMAWDALNRTSLALRQAEDRLGIECVAR